MAGAGSRFAEGVRLFNKGSFFEAHELWEHEWRIAEGEEKIFFQAIIQAAAALLHFQRSSYAGALSVYLKSLPKLERLPAVWMGIDLGRFRSELRQYFAPLRCLANANRGNSQPVGAARIAARAQPPSIRWVSI
jgi:uncharacterized protein